MVEIIYFGKIETQLKLCIFTEMILRNIVEMIHTYNLVFIMLSKYYVPRYLIN